MENSQANWIIDRKLECETRMLPLPVHPMLSPYEIMLLQTCVRQTQHMCMQLPNDISSVVCRMIHADYTVSPHVGVASIVRAIDGNKACLKAPHLLQYFQSAYNTQIQDVSLTTSILALQKRTSKLSLYIAGCRHLPQGRKSSKYCDKPGLKNALISEQLHKTFTTRVLAVDTCHKAEKQQII